MSSLKPRLQWMRWQVSIQCRRHRVKQKFKVDLHCESWVKHAVKIQFLSLLTHSDFVLVEMAMAIAKVTGFYLLASLYTWAWSQKVRPRTSSRQGIRRLCWKTALISSLPSFIQVDHSWVLIVPIVELVQVLKLQMTVPVLLKLNLSGKSIHSY